MSDPLVLVGTLHCGEAEFHESAAMVARQQGVRVRHEVIADRAEREAHNALWRTWNEARYECALFVKVDADTILRDATVLAQIHSRFAQDPAVTGMQIPLHDYFSDASIAGLNAFGPPVHFRMSEDDLYCDRNCEVGHRKVLRGADVAALAPAGFHCRNPHPRQAFHFGYRRFRKGQFETLQATAAAWRRYGGEGRLWALAGACAASRRAIPDASYSNPAFEDLFASWKAARDRAEQIETFLPVLDRQRAPVRGLLGGTIRRMTRFAHGLWR